MPKKSKSSKKLLFKKKLSLPLVAFVILFAAVGVAALIRSFAATINGKLVYEYPPEGSANTTYIYSSDGSGQNKAQVNNIPLEGGELTRSSDGSFVSYWGACPDIGPCVSKIDGSATYVPSQGNSPCNANNYRYQYEGDGLKHNLTPRGLPRLSYVWTRWHCVDGTPQNQVDSTIYSVDADGQNKSTLVAPTSGTTYNFLNWSPDDNDLYFIRQNVKDFSIMDLMVRQPGSVVKLLAAGIIGYSVSGDGTKIVYGMDNNTARGTFIMNSDGTNKVKFSNSALFYDTQPQLNNDGSWLVYLHRNLTTNIYQLKAIRTDGSTSRVLDSAYDTQSSNVRGIYNIKWSPTYDWIAYAWEDQTSAKLQVRKIKLDGTSKTTLLTFPYSNHNSTTFDW